MMNDIAAETGKKAGFLDKISPSLIETLTVIMLGITALLTAWASYTGSIHGGNQATNYATSNNLASDGNSRYNEAVQNMSSDMQLWNTISEYQVDIVFASEFGNEDDLEEVAWKLIWICNDNLTEEMAEKIGWSWDFESSDDILTWLETEESVTSPFTDEDFVYSYYEDAFAVLEESEAVLAQGQEDNNNGDKYTLVTVIFSVVLFLLGIIGVFNDKRNKVIVLTISIVAFILAVGFMLTIPLPTSGGIFG